jgi:hypothetical protein
VEGTAGLRAGFAAAIGERVVLAVVAGGVGRLGLAAVAHTVAARIVVAGIFAVRVVAVACTVAVRVVVAGTFAVRVVVAGTFAVRVAGAGAVAVAVRTVAGCTAVAVALADRPAGAGPCLGCDRTVVRAGASVTGSAIARVRARVAAARTSGDRISAGELLPFQAAGAPS